MELIDDACYQRSFGADDGEVNVIRPGLYRRSWYLGGKWRFGQFRDYRVRHEFQ